MDDFNGSTGTWAHADTGWGDLGSAPDIGFNRWAQGASAFAEDMAPKAIAPQAADTGALPGATLTAAVTTDREARRTLMRIFVRLARECDITKSTLASLEAFLEDLPRGKQLPTVSVDGEGGLTLAWTVPNEPRTLITVHDWMLYPVVRAGSVDPVYLPDCDFDGTIPEELLAIIPD